MRITEATVLVLNAFTLTGAPLSGAQIAAETGLMSGTLYPILHRLEAQGFLLATPEEIDPSEIGRPRRIFYRLSADKAGAATLIVRKSRWANRLIGSAKAD